MMFVGHGWSLLDTILVSGMIVFILQMVRLKIMSQ